jgi:hypothetical protein
LASGYKNRLKKHVKIKQRENLIWTKQMKKQTREGFNRAFRLNRFEAEEKHILNRLSKEWYLTSSGTPLKMSASKYEYFLMKPIQIFSEMFNLDRELVCVFSDYSHFEPRSLDAFTKAQESITELRAETVCKVLISKDPDIENKIDLLLKTDPEQPIIIPFTYEELSGPIDPYFMRNRFRKHFYTRDLFDFLSPLKSDLYFFGRSQLIHEIVNRHKSNEHTGLFGLRKSGKTSIIYAVERTLKASGENHVSIDCESPSVHILRWNELLEKIVLLFQEKLGSKINIDTSGRYEEKYASESFEKDIQRIHQSKKKQTVLFIFDEIERISPGTASSNHWRDGTDFIFFWQTLRGFYQKNPGIFTYMLVGTNPSCIENATLVGHENPIFASIPCQYVPIFNVEQVRQMVGKLGRFIGLEFDDVIYSKLTDDFGGHPFLIRQACSVIHNECKGDRPAKVDKPLYEKVKKQFFNNASHYLDMVVQVLKDWYPDEFEMLKYLAQEDTKTFTDFAEDNLNFTKHLIGYGLLQKSSNGYAFNIEALKKHLGNQYKYERINMSESDKLQEISTRRNAIEKSLRKISRNTLKMNLGKKKGLEKMISAIPSHRRESLESYDIDGLLSPDSSPLFLLDITNLFKRDWEIFKHIFEMGKTKLILMLEEINQYGRPDAHAKKIDNNQFQQLRIYFSQLEVIVDEWS